MNASRTLARRLLFRQQVANYSIKETVVDAANAVKKGAKAAAGEIKKEAEELAAKFTSNEEKEKDEGKTQEPSTTLSNKENDEESKRIHPVSFIPWSSSGSG